LRQKNKADAFLYQAEKSLEDLGAKAGEELAGKVKEAIGKLKEAINGGEAAKIQTAMDDLKKPLYEMTTAAYKSEDAPKQEAPQAEAAPEEPAAEANE